MEKDGDPTRALLLVLMVLMMILESTQSDTEKCPTSPSPPDCVDDCTDKKWYYDQDKGNCLQCPDCGPGQGLDSNCGGTQGAQCVSCVPGVSFSDPSGYCYSCRHCDNTVGDTPCNITHDTVCGKCQTGYYHEKGKPDQCHPCHFLQKPELEPQCQIPQELPTDPPQEVLQESTTADRVLEPTTNTRQIVDHDSSSPASGDQADQVIPPTVSFEDEAQDNLHSDLVEDEQVDDAAMPSYSIGVSNATLIICVTILIILTSIGLGFLYIYQKKCNSQRSSRQHCRKTDYVGVDVEDSSASVELDVSDQTATYRANKQAKTVEPVSKNQLRGQLSDNSGALSHVGSADSVRSSTCLVGDISSDPYLRRHLTSTAIMTDADEGDEIITKPINTDVHSSASRVSPKNGSDYADPGAVQARKTPSFDLHSQRRLRLWLGGEPVFIPSNQEESSKESLISPGHLPGKAGRVGNPHLTSESWNMGGDSHTSIVTSGYPEGKGGVSDPAVTLCKDDGTGNDKASTGQAASALSVEDVPVSLAVVVDATSVLHDSPSPAADTQADKALAMTDGASAAAVNAVTAGDVAGTAVSAAVDETDGAAEIEDTPAAGQINTETCPCVKSNCSSPLINSTSKKKKRKSKVRVAPSDLDSSTGNEKRFVACDGHQINVHGRGHKVFVVGNNSHLNVGCSFTDTESDE